MKPQLIVQQKITAFTNKYRIYQTDESGKPAELRTYAQQKKLAFKEKVTFYDDEKKSHATFTFRAEKVMDVHGKYFVEDTNGEMIGMFKKEFTESLLNSTWRILDTHEQELFIIKESNQYLAIARRFIGVIPIIGELLELTTNFLKYHFVFIDSATNLPVGMYKKTTLFRDQYTLSMTDEAYAKVDWRVLAAMGVGLDALQSR